MSTRISSGMDFTLVKISTTVPKEDAETMRDVLGKAGAGAVGNYAYCSFSITGKGRFTPNAQANPHIGKVNTSVTVEEEQIEVVCQRTLAKKVVAALRKAHPYEEPIIDIIPLLDEDQL